MTRRKMIAQTVGTAGVFVACRSAQLMAAVGSGPSGGTHALQEAEVEQTHARSVTKGEALPEVMRTSLFVATPCRDCDVPGYLVLQPTTVKSGELSELPQTMQEQLGVVLAKLEAAVREVTAAQHVYVLRFSEGLSSVHFHIFPRTEKLRDLWVRENPEAARAGVNGPLLFAWARIRYHILSPDSLSTVALETAKRIQSALHGSKA